MNHSKIILLTSFFSVSLLTISCSSSNKSESSNTAAQTSDAKPAEVSKEQPGELKTIYFEFNKYNIKNDQKENTNQIVKYLKANPKIKVQIQGHTDNRGSSEYNMALGMKRAMSLKNYLTANKVTNDLDTISFGEEKPAVKGDTEEAWTKNRRGEVVQVK
ncbi:OmpA family protein [Silvanigrella aquatica]|uniref:Peptidoglycan-associated lipoprotein n=1 Tax=Silvanigrella aquatica TaxID=1915309 RepID=A0A1L4D369_9BACT|nr:OmpA family protein [Silvanigrella aquatica]APJ04632.1 hypothetical protein AXG55_12250 [Silvanigrella aquatica]